MALEKMRRFVFVLAAVVLFLATVMPVMEVSATLADSPHMITMASTDGMNCPDCDTSQDSMIGCTQAICIGLAVLMDDDCFDVSAMRPAYAIAAVAWPDGFTPAPSNPPI